jgi:hypothetical protein
MSTVVMIAASYYIGKLMPQDLHWSEWLMASTAMMAIWFTGYSDGKDYARKEATP